MLPRSRSSSPVISSCDDCLSIPLARMSAGMLLSSGTVGLSLHAVNAVESTVTRARYRAREYVFTGISGSEGSVEREPVAPARRVGSHVLEATDLLVAEVGDFRIVS